MALLLHQSLYFTVICLTVLRLINACVNDHGCPRPKSCCDGICRFSCTCTSSSDCDWNEKCCSDRHCVDGFELCPQHLPVYFITVAACSMAFITFLCLMLICYWARCCPWYKNRIARRRKHQKDVMLERSYFTTLSATNMTQELHFSRCTSATEIFTSAIFTTLDGKSREIFKLYCTKNMPAVTLYADDLIIYSPTNRNFR